MKSRPRSFNLRRERLRVRQDYCARIFRYCMGSKSSIPSSTGDSIGRAPGHEFSLTHFWCFDCRESKPRFEGVMCLCVLGNFCCGDCNKESKNQTLRPQSLIEIGNAPTPYALVVEFLYLRRGKKHFPLRKLQAGNGDSESKYKS
ncbi:hypothetical protein TNIN_411961 [Trichonephila inaurata madagascariensis]|uniref:Uncharacterized protein n=1 Tax=Trichonephila inaurata madagascariensis TaxID=2747483 RepID=A0A8X6Y200_9ARAC|nr:hypothetical protein TNIN_411961 [Trichonephila inaurata madagascariensis]